MDVFRIRRVPIGEHMLVVVRYDRLLRTARSNLAPSDDDRNINSLGGHRLESILQGGAFGRTRKVSKVWLVDRRRNPGNARNTGRGFADGARRGYRLVGDNRFSTNSHNLILGH